MRRLQRGPKSPVPQKDFRVSATEARRIFGVATDRLLAAPIPSSIEQTGQRTWWASDVSRLFNVADRRTPERRGIEEEAEGFAAEEANTN